MDQEPDVIRQNIDETRSSLTEKLETLEAGVKGTVQGAKATVEDTIHNVKSSVQETVDSVKRTFDVAYQVRQHPWPMLGGSVVAGFILGNLLGPRKGGRRDWESYRKPQEPSAAAQAVPTRESAAALPNGTASGTSGPSTPGLLERVMAEFDDEIQQVKGLAVGAAIGILRDLAKEALPPALAPQVEQIMDSVASKLGGKPVRGPVLEPSAAAVEGR